MDKPRIKSVGIATPENKYSQDYIFNALGHRELFRPIFTSSGLEGRHLCLDPKLIVSTTAQEAHENYIRFAIDLSVKSATDCLGKAEITAKEIDAIVFASCTGFECPSIDYYVAEKLGLRPDAGHFPIVGTGCQGAVPALRIAYHLAKDGAKVLVVACEIINAAYHPTITDEGRVNRGIVIGNAIFADGSASALVTNNGPGLNMLDFYNIVDHGLRDRIGMEWKGARLRLVLSTRVSRHITPLMKLATDKILARNRLSYHDIPHWLIHSGGESILDEAVSVLGITQQSLHHSFKVWQEYGNMSSPTLLFSLGSLLESNELNHGDYVILLGMGAGAEVIGILGQWRQHDE